MLEHARSVHQKRLSQAQESTPLTAADVLDTIGKIMQRAFWVIVVLRILGYMAGI